MSLPNNKHLFNKTENIHSVQVYSCYIKKLYVIWQGGASISNRVVIQAVVVPARCVVNSNQSRSVRLCHGKSPSIDRHFHISTEQTFGLFHGV